MTNQYRRKEKKGAGMAARFGLLSIFLVSLVFYTVKITGTSTLGNDMTTLERQKEALELETMHLDAQIARNRSLQSIQERLAGMDLVKASEVTYLEVGTPAVARR